MDSRFNRFVVLATLLLFFLLPGLLKSQPNSIIERIQELEQLKENPLYKSLLGEKEALSPEQIRILDLAVEKLSDTEINQSLKMLGLSESGSAIARKNRLKIALGIKKAPKLPGKRKKSRLSIENASEGEYIQGAEDGNGMLKLQGRIRVGTPKGSFTANLVIIDTNRQEIYGEGDVVFLGKNSKINAERIIYNSKLNTGIMYNAAGVSNPVFVIGKSIRQIRDKRFTSSHAWFTTNAARIPHYHFTAKRIWVYEDNTVFAAGVWYHIGGVPIIPLPFMYASDWGTGIITQIGHSDVQGWFMENTYQFSDPDSYYSIWRPNAWRFKADWHETVGEVFGIEFFKYSPNINYFFDMGVARYKRYNVIGDFRENDNIDITNQVVREDGTIGKDYQKWFKIFALVNFRLNNRKENIVRNLHLRFEDYKHPLYDYEFGGRYQPDSTTVSLFEGSEAGRGIIHTNTDWSLIYSEQRGDLTIRVGAQRNRVWDTQTGFSAEGEYIPVRDVAPEVDLGYSFDLGDLPILELPIFWDHKLHTDLEKVYSLGKEFKNKNTNQYETSFHTFTGLYPWISFEPRVGYGIQKTIPDSRTDNTTDDTTLRLEAAKNSYQYTFTKNAFTLGPDEIFLRLTHTFKDSFKEDQDDAPVVNLKGFAGNQKTNETDILFETKPFINTRFSLNAVYDHREFPDLVETKERWSYPIFRSEIFIDFFNFGRESRENLLSRNKVHFLGLRLTNDYVYDPIEKRDHSDVVGVIFEMGGFDLWFLKRLRYLEMGYYWYHVYFNPALDHMRYNMKMDIQLWQWGYLEMEMESRATDIERYSGGSVDDEGNSNHVNFTKDIVNGTGLNGRQKREESVFNVALFRTALILDVEDFEYRIGYEVTQESIFAGATSLEFVNYYDNRVFFSITFLKFNLGRTSADQARFILNRKRLKPGQVGRQDIQ